ncbi:MAG: carbohydrate ABC transporter permease [Bacillota bacterium]|nr:carbohydrate ABC transporter permease [Bacillota bacterium]
MVFVSISLLFPVIYMFANSFMGEKEIQKNYGALMTVNDSKKAEPEYMSFKLIPDPVSFMQYYKALLRSPKFLQMFWNSCLLTLPILLGQLIVSTLAAFAFSKFKFPLRNVIFFMFIIVMMMPFQVSLVPNYIILKKLNLLGGYLSVILPGTFSTFGVFLLRQFMISIPDELCEAAKVDGASSMRIFLNIILPQCKGALASLAILVFIDNWNMVEQPLIFLKDQAMYPLSIFLSAINGNELGIAFACGLIYMIPAVLIFLYGEKYLVEGIKLSGMK